MARVIKYTIEVGRDIIDKTVSNGEFPGLCVLISGDLSEDKETLILTYGKSKLEVVYDANFRDIPRLALTRQREIDNTIKHFMSKIMSLK